VIDTKDTPYWSNRSTSFAKSAKARVRRDQDQLRDAQDQAGSAIRFVEEQDDIGGRSRPPLRPIMDTAVFASSRRALATSSPPEPRTGQSASQWASRGRQTYTLKCGEARSRRAPISRSSRKWLYDGNRILARLRRSHRIHHPPPAQRRLIERGEQPRLAARSTFWRRDESGSKRRADLL
jgi:hypothetical protein